MEDVYGHGTAVASIIAGARNDAATQGMAFNSTIVMMKADAPGSCPSSCYFVNIADAIDAARLAGARVINLSIGGEARSDIADAVRRAAQAGIVIVIGAGNDGAANPTGLAQSIASEAPGQVIIVGALGSGEASSISYDQMLSYSNRAGSSTSAYLSAPGYLINVVVPSGGVDQLSGTSFSAPVVSGAIALLAEAFPNLSARQLVQLLMDTADDIGSTGADSVYGRGRLNVGRAFQPVGKTNLAGEAIPVSFNSNGTLPAAAGDAVSDRSLRTIVLDAYKRAFQINLATTLQAHPESLLLSRSLMSRPRVFRDAVGPFEMGMTLEGRSLGLEPRSASHEDSERRDSARFLSTLMKIRGSKGVYALGFGTSTESLARELDTERSYAAFVVNDGLNEFGFERRARAAAVGSEQVGPIRVTWSGEVGGVAANRAVNASSSYRLVAVGLDKRNGLFGISAQLSSLAESNTVLGGYLSEVFGRQGAATTFLSINGQLNLVRNLQVSMDLTQGWTKFAAGGFSTGAYSFQLSSTGIATRNDLLALRVSQPLRVERGGFSMLLPSSYDYKTEMPSISRAVLPLTPSSREVTGEIAYSSNVQGADLKINGYMRLNPGHVSRARPDVGLTVRFAKRF